LRRILAWYTGERPENLRFSYTASGKPRLDSAAGGRRIEFNVGHSGQRAVYAIANGRRVGVDIERIVPIAGHEERLSRSWLSEQELAEMSTMDGPGRTRRFYSLWTRKEAYLKARGDGFSLAPDRVRIPLEPAGASFESDFEPGAAQRWSLLELES